MSPFPTGTTYGAYFFSTLLCAILWGVSCIQTWEMIHCLKRILNSTCLGFTISLGQWTLRVLKVFAWPDFQSRQIWSMAHNYGVSLRCIRCICSSEFIEGRCHIVRHLQAFRCPLLIFSCGFSTMNAAQTGLIVHGGKLRRSSLIRQSPDIDYSVRLPGRSLWRFFFFRGGSSVSISHIIPRLLDNVVAGCLGRVFQCCDHTRLPRLGFSSQWDHHSILHRVDLLLRQLDYYLCLCARKFGHKSIQR